MARTQFGKSMIAFGKHIREAGVKWDSDNASRLSAALAYYTIFSLAPLLVLAIAVAGLFFGDGAARDEALHQLQGVIGSTGAQYVDNLIDLAQKPSSTLLASLLGVVTLLVGATSAFVELQQALNTLWRVEPSGRSGLKNFLHERLLSFAAILAIGGILLTLLLLSALLAFMGRHLSDVVPAYLSALNWLNLVMSFGITTLLFAAVYKVLPDAHVKWREVWMGAGVASLLFSLGKYFIGLYLRHSSLSSLYGAAGSLAVILFWIYYSAHILFFGAEITVVSASRRPPKSAPESPAKDA